MALSDSDLDGFTSEVEEIPSKTQGVSVSTIPTALVNLLEKQIPTILDQKGKEIILRVPVKATKPQPIGDAPTLPEGATKEQKAEHEAATKAHQEAYQGYVKALAEYQAAEKKATDTVKQLCLYAGAWGKGQTPKLYVRKVMNRKDMPGYHARLAADTWSKVPEDNRPGRRTNS